MVSTIGAFMIALSTLVFMHNFFRSLKKGEPSGGDPWDGRTLEWAIPSPPPEYNFVTIPTVTARDHFWEEKQLNINTPSDALEEEDGHGIHMPSPSYIPLVTALGLAVFGYGLIYSFAMAGVGAFVTVVGIYAWAMEPATAPED